MKVARIWWAFRHEQKALWQKVHYFSVFYNYNIECQRSIETPGRCAMSCQWSIPVVRPVLFAHVEKKWRCPKVIRPNVLLVPRQIPINYRTISFKPLDHGRDWESKTRLVWYCYKESLYQCTYCGFGDKDELTGSFMQHMGMKGEDELFSYQGRGLISPNAVSPSGRYQISAFVE
jgi:hypothetical protein